MKLTIVTLVLVACLAQSASATYNNNWQHETTNEARLMKSMPKDLLNRTECIYAQDSRMFSCHGPTGVVECETELTWGYPVQFELFGLAKCENHTDRYRVLPRRLDNTAWDDNKLVVDGVEKRIELYYGEETNELGLRVMDKKCWTRLDTLFKNSLRNEKVWYYANEVLETTYLIGDLMVTEHTPEVKEETTKSKRWWGRGFGLYGNLYGMYGGYGGMYGGYGLYRGFGLGYGYYGKRSGLPSVEYN